MDRIFLIEDHPIYREGLSNYVNEEGTMAVCGTADNVADALDGIERTNPHLAVVDLTLRDSNGLDLIQHIRYRWPNLRILVLSMHDEVKYADRVLKMGARGYVMKDKGPETVLRAIQAVLRGELYASERYKEQLLHGGQRKMPTDALTDRELQVFQLLGEGRSVSQIAEMLSISPKTVQNHIDHIKNRLNIQTRQELYQVSKEWVMGRV